MGPVALDRLIEAYESRLAGVPRAEPDRPTVGYVGSDVPVELFDAVGVRAVRVCGDPTATTPMADSVAEAAIDGMARSQLERLLDGTYSGLAAVVISHDAEASARLFHYAAECRHQGIGEVPPVHMADVVHLPHETSTRYVAAVVEDLCLLAGELAGRTVTDEALIDAIARSDERRHLLRQVAELRRLPAPRLSGEQALAVIGAAATLTVDEHVRLLAELVDGADELIELAGRRVFVTGSAHDHPDIYRELEDGGDLVVGEDHDWGDAWFDGLVGTDESPIRALALRYQRGAPRSGRHLIAHRASYLAEHALASSAELVRAILRSGDDGPPWDVPAQRAAVATHDIALGVIKLDGYSDSHLTPSTGESVVAPVTNAHPSLAHEHPMGSERTRGRPTDSPRGAERAARPKGLESSRIATAYQREWFAAMREQVANGMPLAVVNADAPHEILRSMGIPYVVNQWWASVCAAKQQGPRYLGLLRDLGYPDDVEAYSAMALGSALDSASNQDPTDVPWGGLPPVDLLVAETTTDATAKIFETWADAQGAELMMLEATVAPLEPRRWFDAIHDDWEQVLGRRRIDLMVGEINELIRRIEDRTDRRFDEKALADVMTLANEQAEWNGRTRDLIAATSPAPIGVADAIPATMIPQWHRGSEWGRDAARRLHDEVAELVEAGHGVVPDEQARLMWIGRGLWFDMGFYQHFQERHGAVFVWSMYLAVAADAYLRRGSDPLRTLAGRFCGFADLYNTPPWSSEWYAKEALHNQIDGVVHLTTDAVRGTHFITRAIEAAGVPVLEISGSNVDSRDWDAEAVTTSVDTFIERRVMSRAEQRRRIAKA